MRPRSAQLLACVWCLIIVTLYACCKCFCCLHLHAYSFIWTPFPDNDGSKHVRSFSRRILQTFVNFFTLPKLLLTWTRVHCSNDVRRLVTVHWHGAEMGSVGGGDAGMSQENKVKKGSNISPSLPTAEYPTKRIDYNNMNATNIKTQLIRPRPRHMLYQS